MLPPVVTKQKIANKLLLILVVPLLLQFMAGALLWGLSSDFEKLRTRERQLADLTELRGRQFAMFTGASMDYFGAGIDQSVKQFQRAENQFSDLLKTVENDQSLLIELRTFHNHITDRMLEGMQEPVDDPNLTAAQIAKKKYKQAKKYLDEAGEMARRWNNELAESRQLLDDTRRSESQNRDLMRLSVIAVALAEVAMSISLAVYIIGGTVTKRLSVLVENAYRLPRGMPLENEVKGADELSYLDQSLHEAADYLKEAGEQRSLLMEMIAHDMRSPLMSAQIATDLVSQGSPEAPDSVRRNIVQVKRNLEMVINLVNDLLTIDRLEAGALALNKSTFELNPFVDGVIDSVEAIAGAKSIRLQNLTDPEVYVTADRDRITQVLTNLIANAVKFSPKDSAISISVTELERYSQICVSDEGPGLPPGSEKKIFEKFNQVKREHAKAGYGLGLTICKMLVELHGGTIAAQSLPEKGSKFCFSLPREFDIH